MNNDNLNATKKLLLRSSDSKHIYLALLDFLFQLLSIKCTFNAYKSIV